MREEDRCPDCNHAMQVHATREQLDPRLRDRQSGCQVAWCDCLRVP